jgi:hypothetical protein
MLMYGDLALQLVYLVRKGLWSGHNNIMISSLTEHEAPGHPLHATVQHLKNEKKRKDNEGDNEGDFCEEGLHLSLYCKGIQQAAWTCDYQVPMWATGHHTELPAIHSVQAHSYLPLLSNVGQGSVVFGHLQQHSLIVSAQACKPPSSVRNLAL